MPNEFEPEVVGAVYVSGDGPELRIPRETIHDLIALANERSGPGASVAPSVLVAEALEASWASTRRN